MTTQRLLQRASTTAAVLTRRRHLLPQRGAFFAWGFVGAVSVMLGFVSLSAIFLPTRWLPPFLAAVLFPFIALIFQNVRRPLLAVIVLDIPLQLDVHFAYRDDTAVLGALSGWNVSATSVSLVILYALWLSEILSRRSSRTLPPLRTILPPAIFLAFTAASLLVARDVTLSLFELFLLAQIFFLYVYIVGTVRDREDVAFIVGLLVAGLALESLIMIAVFVSGRDFSIGPISTRVDSVYGVRVGGTLGSPNGAGAYLTLLLAPSLSILVTSAGRWPKRLAAVAVCLGLMALILPFSRGALVAFAVSSAIVCWGSWRRGWLPWTIPAAAVAAIIPLALLANEPIAARVLGDDGGSARGRIPLMQVAFRMIADHPLWGIGTNNFAIMLGQYTTPEFAGTWLYIVHNKYLLVWAETGIGGLLAFVLFLLVTIRRGRRGWAMHDRFLSSLSLGFTAAVIGHMIHMLVDLFNQRPETQLLWLIAGIITAISRIEGRPEETPATSSRVYGRMRGSEARAARQTTASLVSANGAPQSVSHDR